MIRWRLALVVVAAASTIEIASAQTRRRTPAPPPPPPPPAPVTVTPEVTCPTPLGTGVTSKRLFCDVMSGRDPAAGVLIKLPTHQGPATLTFSLHNRHTYSEEQVHMNRAYARYTATVGVLTMDNTLIGRAIVQSEFRKAADLVDRVSGGSGPGGVKAVAPTGTEVIVMSIPEGEEAVSILGEKLTIDNIDGTATYSSTGRPIAIVSDVTLEYVPPPPPKPKPAPAPARSSRGRR